MGGTNNAEGRVEICLMNEWGTGSDSLLLQSLHLHPGPQACPLEWKLLTQQVPTQGTSGGKSFIFRVYSFTHHLSNGVDPQFMLWAG